MPPPILFLRSILVAAALAAWAGLCGCAAQDPYRDEREFSNMPWNTPQQWEGSRQIPGLSPGY